MTADIKTEAAKTCRNCGGKDLSWFTSNTVTNGIQQGRLNTSDVKCLFVLGCDECSETLALKNADDVADEMNAAATERDLLKARCAELEGQRDRALIELRKVGKSESFATSEAVARCVGIAISALGGEHG